MTAKLLLDARPADPDNPWHPEAIAYIRRLPRKENKPAWEHYKNMEYWIHFWRVHWGNLRLIVAVVVGGCIGCLFVNVVLGGFISLLATVASSAMWLWLRKMRDRDLCKILAYRLDERQRAISDRIMELDPDIGPRIREVLDN